MLWRKLLDCFHQIVAFLFKIVTVLGFSVNLVCFSGLKMYAVYDLTAKGR